ncbi:unnamed protein product [Leptosia nina]|uniref:Uncharacterized protein n=1 Tax=Leptosia nina TaxID=320188 RepID=A0AAV1JRS6_9NEOP
MKLLIVLVLVAVAAARPEEFYSSRYDDFDVTQLTENPRLMSSYIQCFMGTGKCTPEGNDISKWIPEAVQSTCAKCTEKQKVLVAKVIKAMMEKHAEDWQKLRAKFDPDNKQEAALKEFIEKHNA